MAINKVNYGDQTLMDLTEDTVTEDKVLEGETFHDRSGNLRAGSLVIPVQDVEVNGESVVNSEKVAEIDIPTADEQTATDEFTTINGGILSSLKVSLTPNQDLHGYDSPWVGGAGKNKLPLVLADIKSANTSGTWSGNVYSYLNITIEVLVDDSDNVLGIKVNGTSSSPMWSFNLCNYVLGNGVEYKLNGITGGSTSTYRLNVSGISNFGSGDNSITGDGASHDVRIQILNGAVIDETIKPMLRLATESDPTFEPYSNICPISGHTQVDVDVSDGDTTQEQVTVNLGGTYYSGTLDVVSGVFTPDTAEVDLGTLTYSRTEISGVGYRYYASDLSDIIKKPTDVSVLPNIVCEQYAPKLPSQYNQAVDGITVYTNGSIQIYDSTRNTLSVSDFKTAMSGVQLVYELDTPTPIQLSPTMVKALVGENHLSAPLDGQEITESKYRQLFTWDEVEEIAQKMADSKIDNLNTSYDTTFSSAFTEARYVKKIYEAPALTALQIVLSGAPSITFNHQLIFSDAQTCCELIQFGSGARIGITDVAISQGSVTFTFDSPLTKAIGFRCRITNDFVS